MCGFTVDRYAARFDSARSEILQWLNSGELRMVEHVEHGIERFPEALAMLFTGGHMGKLLVVP